MKSNQQKARGDQITVNEDPAPPDTDLDKNLNQDGGLTQLKVLAAAMKNRKSYVGQNFKQNQFMAGAFGNQMAYPYAANQLMIPEDYDA